MQRQLPVFVHQTRVFPSSDVVNTFRLFEEKTADFNDNPLSCLSMVSWHWPDFVLQTFITNLKSAVKIFSQSSEKAAEITLAACASKVRKHLHDATLQNFAVVSALAVSNHCPSGEKIAELTLPS